MDSKYQHGSFASLCSITHSTPSNALISAIIGNRKGQSVEEGEAGGKRMEIEIIVFHHDLNLLLVEKAMDRMEGLLRETNT